MRFLKEINSNIRGEKFLVRCDFNVPLSESGKILDDFRIRQTLPTINRLIRGGAKIILMSHLAGDSSLKPVARKLERLLGEKILFLSDYLGKNIKGNLILLENLRSNGGEEENDENFARELAKLGDVFVNDAFGVCHRKHASVVAITKYLPSYVGFLLEKELKALKKIAENPKKPLVAIIGGAKVETKVKLIDKISKTADFVLIGGLLKKELREKNIKLKNPGKIIIPQDEGSDIEKGDVKIFQEKIALAKTIFWNGPLGKVEKKEFQNGTMAIAKAIIKSRAYSVAGGGETIWFLGKKGLIKKFSHASTGGGAMMVYLSGEKLPGLEALNKYGRDDD